MGIIVIIILVVAVVIIMSQVIAKERAKEKTENIDKQLQELRQQILVVTSSTIAGKEIKDVIGNVTGVSKISASRDAEFKLAEKEALYDIINQAINLGANAIIDLKLTTGSYQQQGSQWMVIEPHS